MLCTEVMHGQSKGFGCGESFCFFRTMASSSSSLTYFCFCARLFFDDADIILSSWIHEHCKEHNMPAICFLSSLLSVHKSIYGSPQERTYIEQQLTDGIIQTD